MEDVVAADQPETGQADSPAMTLLERAQKVEDYIASASISKQEFARRSGVSLSVISKVLKFEQIRESSAKVVDDFLAGRTPAVEPKAPLPVLDPATAAMASVLFDLAAKNTKMSELGGTCMRRLLERNKGTGYDVVNTIVTKYLLSFDEPEARIKAAFDLHSIVKRD